MSIQALIPIIQIVLETGLEPMDMYVVVARTESNQIRTQLVHIFHFRDCK